MIKNGFFYRWRIDLENDEAITARVNCMSAECILLAGLNVGTFPEYKQVMVF